MRLGVASRGLGRLCLVVACIIALWPQPSRADTITNERLGSVPYSLPPGRPSDVVILFADHPNDPDTRQVAARLTGLGAAVATVDAGAYTRSLIADKPSCAWLSSDVEDLNRALQRKLQFPAFRVPVLASTGVQGGQLVYGLLAEAPSYSFAGGASVGFSAHQAQPLNICGIGLSEAEDKTLLPAVDIQQPWTVEAAANAADTADWIADIKKADLVPSSTGSVADRLNGLVKPLLTTAVSTDPNSIEDLPVIEMPTGKPAPYVAIVYSGDGGWRDLDRTLGQVLSSHGVPVVGFDSLLYFWQPKRPEVVAHDLDRVMDHYRQAWHIDKFVLVGYSFGADIMPFAYNRLLSENKARIPELSLLALSRNTRFEISVSEYFSDRANAATMPVEPELAKIPSALVQCFYGADEADESACTTPAAARDEDIKTPGGHHFGDDYEALATRIMDGAAKRLK